MIHLFTAETDVSMVLASCPRASEIRPTWKPISDLPGDAHTYPSCCFVSVEIEAIYLEYIQQCFALYFICKSGETCLLRLLQIIDIPYWILKDFDMVNLSTLEIVFHPFMTVA